MPDISPLSGAKDEPPSFHGPAGTNTDAEVRIGFRSDGHFSLRPSSINAGRQEDSAVHLRLCDLRSGSVLLERDFKISETSVAVNCLDVHSKGRSDTGTGHSARCQSKNAVIIILRMYIITCKRIRASWEECCWWAESRWLPPQPPDSLVACNNLPRNPRVRDYIRRRGQFSVCEPVKWVCFNAWWSMSRVPSDHQR